MDEASDEAHVITSGNGFWLARWLLDLSPPRLGVARPNMWGLSDHMFDDGG